MSVITTSQSIQRDILSVSQLAVLARQLLEDCFPLIWVEGEISNLARPASGHAYFSLKDHDAQVRCAFFRAHQKNFKMELKDGLKILVRAKVSLYTPRGDFQLIVETLEEVGSGELQRAFLQLKQKLSDKGLFSTAHKKPISPFPRTIGIITSPTGAAIRDILSVLKRRCPSIPIIIYPTLVQGEKAAAQIVNMLKKANQHKACDVLIVARGGGSIEDLLPFNEEIVAEAIYDSEIPIVSGIGHEIDFTIADFVADQRAPTPSAAAEMVSPDRLQWLQHLTQLGQRIYRHIAHEIKRFEQHCQILRQKIKHPNTLLRERAQLIDYLEQQLRHAMTRSLFAKQTKLHQLKLALHNCSPKQKLPQWQDRLWQLKHRLNAVQITRNHQAQLKLNHLSATLHAYSPLTTLERGYAIIKTLDGNIIRHSEQVQIGDNIQIKLHHGELTTLIVNKE